MLKQCPDIEKLAAYLDGDRAREEKSLVEAHLVDCDACRKTVSLSVKSESAVQIDP